MHTHSSNRLLHKSMPTIFLIMSYSAFAAMLWQILKSHFERKQSKTDYPKNIWEEEKCYHKCIGAGARKVENLIRFLSNFDPYFPDIHRARKRCKISIESIGMYCKNIESIENMYWNRSCILCCIASKFWDWIVSHWNR